MPLPLLSRYASVTPYSYMVVRYIANTLCGYTLHRQSRLIATSGACFSYRFPDMAVRSNKASLKMRRNQENLKLLTRMSLGRSLIPGVFHSELLYDFGMGFSNGSDFLQSSCCEGQLRL